jgi:hypothetical protein
MRSPRGIVFSGAVSTHRRSAMSHLFTPRMLGLYLVISQSIALAIALA